MTSWCSWCKEEFDVAEYRPIPADPEDPRFCSDECEEAYGYDYWEGCVTAAPVS